MIVLEVSGCGDAIPTYTVTENGYGAGIKLLRAVMEDVRRRGMSAVWCKASKEKRSWVRKCLSEGFRVAEQVKEDGKDVYKLVYVLQPQSTFLQW